MNYLTNLDSCHDGRLIAYLTDKAISMASESEDAKTWFEILPQSYDHLPPALSRL